MAVAASVTTTIVVKGNDQASKSIKKSQTAMDRLRGSMSKAQDRSQALGQSLRSIASGDITGAVGGLSKGLGGGAGGLAMVAGGATVAVAALAAGVGAAAFKFTEWSSEIERSRAALDNTFGGQGVEKAIAFAREIGGVGVDSVQKLATTLKASGISATITAKQMQELANRATQMGKSGDEALTAFADAVLKGNTRSLQQVGVMINAGRVMDNYARSLGVTTTQLTQAQKQSALLEAVQRDLANTVGASSATYSKQDNVLARLSIAWSELKFKVSEYLAGPAAGILENIADTIEGAAKLARVFLAFGNVIVTAVLTPVRAAAVAMGALGGAVSAIASGKGIKGAGRALAEAFGAAPGFVYGKTADAFSSLADEIGKVGAATKKTVKEISFAGSAFAFLDAQASKASVAIAKRGVMEGNLARARAERARKAAAWTTKAAAARKVAAAEDAAFFKELETVKSSAASADMERRRSEIAALAKRSEDLRAILDAENQLAQIKAAGDPAEVARLQNLQVEAALTREIAQIRANMSIDAAEQTRAIAAVRGIAHSKEMANVRAAEQAQRAATAATIQGYVAAGNAAVALLGTVGVNERAIAAIKAVMASAEAYLAFARGDYVAMASAIVAAASFATVAATSVDTPSGASAPSSAPALGSSGVASPTANSDAGPSSYNITINGVFATAAETGAALKQAIAASSGSGMKAAA